MEIVPNKALSLSLSLSLSRCRVTLPLGTRHGEEEEEEEEEEERGLVTSILWPLAFGGCAFPPVSLGPAGDCPCRD